MAKATYNDDVANFDGQQIFGDTPSFNVIPVVPGYAGGAAAVDGFLGLTPGTTQYGPDPSGGSLWGITGALIAPSSDAVAALQATLLSFAGITSTLGIPTGNPYPSDFAYERSCYFVAAEFVPSPGGIVPIGGGFWSLGYSLIVRQVHGGLGP
jgi:hypothetical protein